MRESRPQSHRSVFASRNRRDRVRCSTRSWCRNARTSSWSAARERGHVRRVRGATGAPTSSPRSVSVVGRHINYRNKNGVFSRHRPLSLQHAPVDGRIDQTHAHHRRGEPPSSGKDPPKAQAVPFDPNAYRRRLHSSGVSLEAFGASNQFRAFPRSDAGRLGCLVTCLPPIMPSASSEGCNVLASGAAKRSCACDSRGIGETQASIYPAPPLHEYH